MTIKSANLVLPADNSLKWFVEPELLLGNSPDDVDWMLLCNVIDVTNAGVILGSKNALLTNLNYFIYTGKMKGCTEKGGGGREKLANIVD